MTKEAMPIFHTLLRGNDAEGHEADSGFKGDAQGRHRLMFRNSFRKM
jgi:hypothetical protein